MARKLGGQPQVPLIPPAGEIGKNSGTLSLIISLNETIISSSEGTCKNLKTSLSQIKRCV